ncbi:MAG: Loki-CTERM sorting domain-containing protein [Promethearchaeota archaeon]
MRKFARINIILIILGIIFTYSNIININFHYPSINNEQYIEELTYFQQKQSSVIPFWNYTNYKINSLEPKISFEDWYRTWGVIGDSDFAIEVSIDSSNDIYTTGFTRGDIGPTNLTLNKFNSTGDMYWSLEWGGILDDRGDGIDIDSDDNLYVVGSTQSFAVGSNDLCLIKFDKNGNLIWNKTWGDVNSNGGTNICVNSNGDLFVSGWTSNGKPVILLLKYNSTGDLQWTKTSSLGSWGMDVVTNDQTGEIYLLGWDPNNIYLIKYNSAGDEQWSRVWNSGSQDGASALALDSYGNIYITGYTQVTSKGEDLLLVKYDPSGNELWNRTWGGNFQDRGQNLCIDSFDNIYITGFLEDSGGLNSFDMCILKYDSNGDLKWDLNWGGNLTDYGFGISLDNLYNIYISGITQSFDDVEGDQFLLKFGSTFTLTTDADIPDLDGSFNLIWTDSLYVDNYSLYFSDSYISEINSSVTLLADQNATSPFLIFGLTNGTYYYIIVAFNEFGNTNSNCLPVEVKLFPPYPFTLTTDASIPDLDGSFNLTWTDSLYADNYSVYFYDSYITEINSSATLLADQNATSPFLISGLSDGVYYYIVVAYNKFGEIKSNNIMVQVKKKVLETFIPGYSLMLLLGVLSVVTIIISQKIKKP